MEKLIIIGGGPAGLTAAIYASRANLHPLLFTGELPGGLLTQTGDVENFPGFPDGINGFDLMLKMQQQAEKFGTVMRYEKIATVDFSNPRQKSIKLDSGEVIFADSIIIATGSTPRWLGLPSEERLRNKGVSACATCDGAFYKNLPVVVAGGGDSAMEEASFLTNFASKVYLIHRRNELRASKIMQERVRNNPKIELILNAQIIDILGENEVEGVLYKFNDADTKITLPCKGFFAALGHLPATGFLAGAIEMDAAGFIKLVHGDTSCNVEGVFAAGDCADSHYRQAITAAGTGCQAALDAEHYLSTLNRR